MPAYTMQRDPDSGRLKTTLASPSTYCDDYDDMLAEGPPPPEKDTREMPHPRQQINDYGPQVRAPRLPVFNQVRSMLKKPIPGKNPKWDKYTGELSEQGVPANVKPSTYKSPYDGAFQARRKSPERPNKSRKGQSPQRRTKAEREQSPVSVLLDEDVMQNVPNQAQGRTPSPVSPVSPIDHSLSRIPLEDQDMVPRPLSANVRQPKAVPTLETPQPIKRKPAPRSLSAAENMPPTPEQRSPSQFSEFDQSGGVDDKDFAGQPTSHFSWTTVAPSIAPGRASTDTAAPGMAGRMSKPPSIYPISQESDSDPQSRFSWSTVNTNMTAHARPDSPPPSPPPPIPEKFAERKPEPQVQSILSRRRPVQPRDREEWTPPPRKSSKPVSQADGTSPADAVTPISTKSLRPPPLSKDPASTPTSAKSSKSGKALPLPPSLSPAHNLTHLETLLAQERDIILQRRNVERAIVDLEKIEKASPMTVDFSQVRDSKKKLEEHRKRLDEVKLEEREIGVAISRARRKEGEEEGLWVRRVTG